MTNKAVLIGGGVILGLLWLRAQRAKSATINYVEQLPFNMNALTLPPVGIYIKNEHAGNEKLLKHELIHWQQYQRLGLLPYYLGYLVDYATVGYDAHPMEIEARQAAGETGECLTNYTECIRNGKALTAHNPQFRM